MGRKTNIAANEQIVSESNPVGWFPCNENFVVINSDRKNGSESILQSSIPTLWPPGYTRSGNNHRMCRSIPNVTPTLTLQMKEVSQTNENTTTREYVTKKDKWLHCSKTVDRNEWKKQLDLCYNNESENMHSTFYHPDTFDQMETKKEAALAAYKYLQEIYIKKNEFDSCFGATCNKKSVFETYRKFLNCLRTFHSLTVQYKCKGFAEKYKDYKSSLCPFGNSGKKWRKFHGLQRYARESSQYGYPMQNCPMCNPVASCSALLHFSSSDDHLHQAVGKYVSYCSQYLPKVTHNILVDTGNKEFHVRDSRVNDSCNFLRYNYPGELQNDVASDASSNLHEKATDSVTTNKVINIEDDSHMIESSGANRVNDELLPDSRRHSGHVHRPNPNPNPNTVHQSSNTKVAQNDMKRRQRHQQQEEDRLENHAYSLGDNDSNLVKGKRSVNQISNGSIQQNVIVGLTKPTQQTILANDGTLTHPVISSNASPELLKNCLNVIATYVHQTQNGNTPAMPQAVNTPAMYQAVNATPSSTELNIVSKACNKKKKDNRKKVSKILTCQKDKPVLFEGKPLFLLEDACDKYRCASNGNKFMVKNISTVKFGILPVVLWKDDDRDKTKLVIHAWNAEKSRKKYVKKRLKLS